MRFFKYGEKGSEVLAIVLPGSLQRSSQVREGDEYEFIELAPGAFFLASKQYLSEVARRDLLSKLGQKVFSQQAAKQGEEARQKQQQKPVEQPAAQQLEEKPVIQFTSPNSIAANAFEAELEKNGFLVVDNEEQAKAVSKALEVQIKQGLVQGVRGFDKRFYIVTREFYETNAARVLGGSQKKECTAQEVAGLLKTSESGALAVLQVMKEEGDALEKRRGVFQLVR